MTPFAPISEDEIPGEGRPVPVGGAGADGQREKVEAAMSVLREIERVYSSASDEDELIEGEGLTVGMVRTILADHTNLKTFRDEATPALAQYVERINAADKVVAAQAEEIERQRLITEGAARHAAALTEEVRAQAETIGDLVRELREVRRWALEERKPLRIQEVASIEAALSKARPDTGKQSQ